MEAGLTRSGRHSGRGHKPQYDLFQRDALIAATLQTKPKGMTHWSCRLMAKAQGVRQEHGQRLWQLHNLKPHLSRTFKLSRDSEVCGEADRRGGFVSESAAEGTGTVCR